MCLIVAIRIYQTKPNQDGKIMVIKVKFVPCRSRYGHMSRAKIYDLSVM